MDKLPISASWLSQGRGPEGGDFADASTSRLSRVLLFPGAMLRVI